MMDFRRALYGMRYNPEVPMARLHTVEGFSKFLDSLQAINHREEYRSYTIDGRSKGFG
ncbi:MAG: hypothetical protein R3C68_09330 [Myxococcota bacterium]